jgi:hypothetical protein
VRLSILHGRVPGLLRMRRPDDGDGDGEGEGEGDKDKPHVIEHASFILP